MALGRLAQLARALPSHGRGRWFKSNIAHNYLVDNRTCLTLESEFLCKGAQTIEAKKHSSSVSRALATYPYQRRAISPRGRTTVGCQRVRHIPPSRPARQQAERQRVIVTKATMKLRSLAAVVA